METIVVIMFGWPMVMAALLIAIVGMLKHSCRFLIAASILSLPFSLYLMGGAGMVWKSFLFMPIAFLLACYLSQKEKHAVAWLLIVMDGIMLMALALAVMTQNHV